MTISKEDLDKVNNHWAIKAISENDFSRAAEVRKARLIRNSIGSEISLEFNDCDSDERLLQRIEMAYEFVIQEGINALLHPSQDNTNMQKQARAGAFLAYDYAIVQKLPDDFQGKIYAILRLIGIAYVGDRWADMRRWLKELKEDVLTLNMDGEKWDKRILLCLSECWYKLIRKKDWDDVDRIRELIANLRKEQLRYEENFLDEEDDSVRFFNAYRLISLYHWAKATELLAVYILQGQPNTVLSELDKHFEAAVKAAKETRDVLLEMILYWLHIAAKQMILSSLWWNFQTINSRVTKFVNHVTKAQSMFELLPPQRAALQEQGLLDTANRAVIVNLPTSGGKTALAQFRILLALNQFAEDGGWVAYVAPTRALVTQITRRLKRDFSPIGIEVVQLTGAVEIDGFEEALLSSNDIQTSYHVLVTTPEKLDLVIRGKKTSRPLVLVVMDEAHNLEDEERGLRIELMLATIKNECSKANFLLLTPYVPNSSDLVEWLAPSKGKSISLGTSAWQPNERIIGIYDIHRTQKRGGWYLTYNTLVTSQNTIHLSGTHKVGEERPLNIPFYKAQSLSSQTAAMANIFSHRGTSIAIGRTINDTWNMANQIANSLPDEGDISEEIKLVQKFMAAEVSPEFKLIGLLTKGIGVHHAGLSDEIRTLMEWLAEERKLKVLCATSTITQGINFPVSSIFLSSRFVPKKGVSTVMPLRDFWNLAGRAGRLDQDNLGIVGLASGTQADKIIEYVRDAVDDVVSSLVRQLDEIEAIGKLNELEAIIYSEQWNAFRSYVAHLWNEKQNLDLVLNETEQLLRNTFGYKSLKDKRDDQSAQRKADALLEATKQYARKISQNPANALLADSTGFAPEGVGKAIVGLNNLEKKLSREDWNPESLFGAKTATLQNLIGIMFTITELSNLQEISTSGISKKRIAEITQAWVNGTSINEIALKYFVSSKEVNADQLTDAISAACKAVYRNLANYGTWGIASLSKLPNSGLKFDDMTEEEIRKYNNLPAMIYYGVRSEPGILMRMNSVPRSVAENLGEIFLKEYGGKLDMTSPLKAKQFVRLLKPRDWEKVKPANSPMSGEDYFNIWKRLSGEL